LAIYLFKYLFVAAKNYKNHKSKIFKIMFSLLCSEYIKKNVHNTLEVFGFFMQSCVNKKICKQNPKMKNKNKNKKKSCCSSLF